MEKVDKTDYTVDIEAFCQACREINMLTWPDTGTSTYIYISGIRFTGIAKYHQLFSNIFGDVE